ncbi:MAG: response regulator [Candidatus Fibromonas sp.]|jgi:two-component system chemotaxis response regulator CheY|nr:response regulator [Candidatus Fibromonas sp.]
MKTLIIDDDARNCKLLEAILKDYGECSVALDGNSAIKLFEESLKNKAPFDLVCLDIMMPEKDGYEVLRILRNLEQNLVPPTDAKSRIIMVTALAEQENKAKAFYENCDGYLIKPVERKLLIEMLNKMGLISKSPT